MLNPAISELRLFAIGKKLECYQCMSEKQLDNIHNKKSLPTPEPAQCTPTLVPKPIKSTPTSTLRPIKRIPTPTLGPTLINMNEFGKNKMAKNSFLKQK